jgi:DNA-directed RNA polymerase sigma subunit (sigma70/sigma32)
VLSGKFDPERGFAFDVRDVVTKQVSITCERQHQAVLIPDSFVHIHDQPECLAQVGTRTPLELGRDATIEEVAAKKLLPME